MNVLYFVLLHAMKKIIAFFFFVVFSLPVCYAQFSGGDGKGVTRIAMSVNLGNNIFSGGAADGIARAGFTADLGTNIFTGGAGDGIAGITIKSTLGNNIFSGGSGDGVAYSTSAVDLGQNIFKGGSGDGESSVVANTDLGTNIFKGGTGDGWAMVAVSGITLPVTLATFTGKWQQNNVLLSWQTSVEINTRHFELERSFNGIDYLPISIIRAAGTSSTIHDYSYVDIDLLSKKPASVVTVYYRLKTVDNDGKATYSGVVVLKVPNTGGYVYSIYPNPAQQFIIIHVNLELLNKHGTIRLADQQGKILLTKRIQNEKERIEIAQFATGIYYVQLLDSNGFLFTQKLIINK